MNPWESFGTVPEARRKRVCSARDTMLYGILISIHAPRGGSDGQGQQMFGSSGLFQSTLPVGGATCVVPGGIRVTGISIHAPRGGSDWPRSGSPALYGYFNPRSPWGERLGGIKDTITEKIISIHAPRGGSDGGRSRQESVTRGYFNPRSPWGERLLLHPIDDKRRVFQSTLPVGGATRDRVTIRKSVLFQSTLPVGGATAKACQGILNRAISIHAPRGGSDSMDTTQYG